MFIGNDQCRYSRKRATLQILTKLVAFKIVVMLRIQIPSGDLFMSAVRLNYLFNGGHPFSTYASGKVEGARKIRKNAHGNA